MEITKEMLEELYINQDLGMTKIAHKMNVSPSLINRRLIKYGIPKRPFHQKGRGNRIGVVLSQETKNKISNSHKGKQLSEEHKNSISIGSRKHDFYINNGYAYVRKPSHPKAKKGGRIKRSTLVAEEKIGRYLYSNEEVHHINRIRDDDRPDNLVVMTKNKHASLHCKEKWKSGKINSKVLRKSSNNIKEV